MQVGDIQHFAFHESDAPPFYNPTCPKFDAATGATKEAPKKKKSKENTYFVLLGQGSSASPVPEAPRARVPVMVLGYVGKPKGMRDVAKERGLLDPAKKYTILNQVPSFDH
jgi:hypothetical protein